MNLSRPLALLVGLAALLVSGGVYAQYIHLLGFPDGHITELGQAERKLAMAFIGVSWILGPCLIWIGILAGRRKVGGRLSVALVLYLLLVAGAIAVDRYFQAHLADGGGG